MIGRDIVRGKGTWIRCKYYGSVFKKWKETVCTDIFLQKMSFSNYDIDRNIVCVSVLVSWMKCVL